MDQVSQYLKTLTNKGFEGSPFHSTWFFFQMKSCAVYLKHSWNKNQLPHPPCLLDGSGYVKLTISFIFFPFHLILYSCDYFQFLEVIRHTGSSSFVLFCFSFHLIKFYIHVIISSSLLLEDKAFHTWIMLSPYFCWGRRVSECHQRFSTGGLFFLFISRAVGWVRLGPNLKVDGPIPRRGQGWTYLSGWHIHEMVGVKSIGPLVFFTFSVLDPLLQDRSVCCKFLLFCYKFIWFGVIIVFY